MTSLDHPSISKLAAALREAGMPAAADGIRVLDDEVRTAALAAAALDVEVGAIANSLVFRTTHGDRERACERTNVTGRPRAATPSLRGVVSELPLLALTSGAHRADTTLLATLTGAERVAKADPDFVREHTGQAIGGVAPMGHPKPIRTLVDNDLARYAVVWAAAGHPKSVFPTTFADLLALTGGMAADVAR